MTKGTLWQTINLLKKEPDRLSKGLKETDFTALGLKISLNAFKVANKDFHSFVSKGFLKKQTASRRVGRLAKLVNKLSA